MLRYLHFLIQKYFARVDTRLFLVKDKKFKSLVDFINYNSKNVFTRCLNLNYFTINVSELLYKSFLQ